ncbi:hypothetical protein [Flavihumibacter profundi]|uniref:hypothetical protein n=1 Tax=Flavihumibacter profundi TaxID=2716883 RepID=UPI001CC6B970|nr:hypothetical protein [Flavihumibacter profundi]MBZ5859125.1 hypothetical protein [Flavihumibacter profundi]
MPGASTRGTINWGHAENEIANARVQFEKVTFAIFIFQGSDTYFRLFSYETTGYGVKWICCREYIGKLPLSLAGTWFIQDKRNSQGEQYCLSQARYAG